MEKYEKPEMEIMEFDETEVEILTENDLPSQPLNTIQSIFGSKKSY